MKCFVCGKDSVGEVCNACIRAENGVYSKSWTYKEGLIVKKSFDFIIDITNARINGSAIISTSETGMNAKYDNYSHYIGAVQNVVNGTYNGKPAFIVHIKTPLGMERYLFFLGFDDENGVRSALETAKANCLKAPAPAAPSYSAYSAPASSYASPAPSYSAPAPAAVPPKQLSEHDQERLNKLNVLLESGILSQEEYEYEKRKLGL